MTPIDVQRAAPHSDHHCLESSASQHRRLGQQVFYVLRDIFSHQHRATTLLITAGFATFVIWMSLGAYQSHYVAALRTLGDTTTHSIIGVPKEGRGDEWSTYLPMLKQAYSEGFPKQSPLKPYFEKLEWFIAIPHLDLSLFFLPNYVLYWVVPGGVALSFQGFYYNVLFIVSALWLLCNLGVQRRYACVCAFMLLFSQFYQVWWTSNFPALGASLLPFAVFTSRIKQPYRFLFLTWAIGHMLFGEMYPPFYLAIAIAIVPFVFAIRTDLLNPKNILFATLAAGIALGCYLALNWEYFHLVSHTSYPGQRVNTGGGSSARSILELIFPTLPTKAPGGMLENIYSLAVAGTILPLTLVSLLPSIKWDRRTIRVSAVFVVVGACLVWYMLVGVPRGLALITPLRMIPGMRMAIGISVLVAFYCVTMISWHSNTAKMAPLILVVAFYALISFLNEPDDFRTKNFFAANYYPWVFSALAIVGAVCFVLFLRKKRNFSVVIYFLLVAMCFVSVIVYGSFNPIMRAKDILKPVHSQVINDWKALYTKDDRRPFGTIGHYGDVLRGENLPALEAIHMVNVDPRIYQRIYHLTSVQAEDLFNQFRGIAFANIPDIDASGATVVFPVRPYTVSFANVVTDTSQDANNAPKLPIGEIAISDVTGTPGKFTVFWDTHLLSPLPISEVFDMHLGCRVSQSWMTRYPVVIPNEPLVPVALQGIAGQITVATSTSEAAKACVSALYIGVANMKPVSLSRASLGTYPRAHDTAAP